MDLRIERIAFRNFRNYETFELSALGAADQMLVGPNAVGKTNVVEGVQLLTALQSFRRPSLDQMVRQGAGFARLDADDRRQPGVALSLQVSGEEALPAERKASEQPTSRGSCPP